MTEKSCTYFGETFGWKRELISDEKYKKIYRHKTPKGFTLFTYIGMRIEHSNNLFVNIDVWNEYYDKDILIVLSDLRKGISPKYIWLSEAKKYTLKHSKGTTEGILIPENLLHEISELKDL